LSAHSYSTRRGCCNAWSWQPADKFVNARSAIQATFADVEKDLLTQFNKAYGEFPRMKVLAHTLLPFKARGGFHAGGQLVMFLPNQPVSLFPSLARVFLRAVIRQVRRQVHRHVHQQGTRGTGGQKDGV
jgi:hypothetical protein